MTASTVLVLGARGRFGQAAARAFADAGWQVVGQMRPGGAALPIAAVRWIEADPQDTAALAAQAIGAQVVVNALSPVYSHKVWKRELPRLTQAAIAVTRELGATLLQPGNVYNFGAALPPQLREDTPQVAATVKGRLRIESESQVRHATADGAMKAVVIRAGDFFGSGQGSWLDLVLAKDLRRGRFTCPGPPELPHAWAYLPDLAQAFLRVAQARDRMPAFETLHFAGHTLAGSDWADALTGVASRQAFLDGVELHLSKEGFQLAFAFLDIDHFKLINDTHGHAAGDAVLMGLTDVLGANTRRSDVIGRLGGEEFGICMPKIRLPEARTLVARLRASVAGQPFPTTVGAVEATCSIGMTMSQPGDGTADLMARADSALYRAKHKGRNRVCVG